MGDFDSSDVSVTSIVHTDRNGHTIKNYHVEGTDFYLPPFSGLDKRFNDLTKLEAREDDILISAYPKCGTHWLFEAIGMLLNGDAEYIADVKESVMMEIMEIADIDTMPSPRLLNSHITPQYLSKDFFEKKAKIVYILRNPKDLLVSSYNHHYKLKPFYEYDGTWDGFFHNFLDGKVEYGNWFQYVVTWQSFISSRPDLPIHIMFYENMKKDLVSEIRRLASFLGLPQNKELHEQISEKCSFKNMKKEKARFNSEFIKSFWRDKKPDMYRKGQVGDWKNWFTVSQNEIFDRVLQEKLSSSSLKFTYEL